MKRYVIGVDPGLDDLRAAVFDREKLDSAGHQSLGALLGALADEWRIQTAASDELLYRAAKLAWEFALELEHLPRDEVLVVVEVPRYAGGFVQKGRSSKMIAEGLRKLNVATGAIVGAAAGLGVEVEQIEPQDKLMGMDGKKAARWFVEQASAEIGRAPPRNQDAIDALWIGMRRLKAG